MQNPLSILSAIVFFCIAEGQAQSGLPYHLDQNVISVGKLAPRTTFMTYDRANVPVASPRETAAKAKLRY